MSFGLKNAGATYQRMVNTLFKSQIGWSMEVYIDNMLIKGREFEEHLDNLQKAFDTLRSIRVRLNPAKCTFGARSGRFLGFLVSAQGMEIHPDYLKSIMVLRPLPRLRPCSHLLGNSPHSIVSSLGILINFVRSF